MNTIVRISFNNGDNYEGTIENGIMNGQGIYKFKNGDIYIGEFAGNIPDIWGKFKWANGSSYEGQFSYGLMNGNGKFIHYNSSIKLSANFVDWEHIINQIKIMNDQFYYRVPDITYYLIPKKDEIIN